MSYLIVFALISLSALFSGLTLGFMSLSKDELERKIKLGDKRAEKVYKVRKNGNLLLCTLLVGNVLVNVILPVFLSEISTGTIAVIMSTSLIVIFGEIVPQALCSRYALQIGSATVPIIRAIQFILYPICKPISMGLDYALGEELKTIYSRKELKAIITEHEADDSSDVDADESKIMKGALEYSNIEIRDVMTPKKNVFALWVDAKLTRIILDKIKASGHTRIPLMANNGQFVSIVLTKRLLGVPMESNLAEYGATPMMMMHDTKLDKAFERMKNERQHMAIVIDEFQNHLGIITLEDIIEEVFGIEIVDETDQYVDMRNKSQKNMVKDLDNSK